LSNNIVHEKCHVHIYLYLTGSQDMVLS